MSEMKITGFTAAPPGWRVVWVDAECEPAVMVTAPMAGWLTSTDDRTGETAIEAATHCPGLVHGEAWSTAWVYPASGAVERPSTVWKILGPGEPLPSEEEFQAEAKQQLASYKAWVARQARQQGGAA